jgi:hypothetical protein
LFEHPVGLVRAPILGQDLDVGLGIDVLVSDVQHERRLNLDKTRRVVIRSRRIVGHGREGLAHGHCPRAATDIVEEERGLGPHFLPGGECSYPKAYDRRKTSSQEVSLYGYG